MGNPPLYRRSLYPLRFPPWHHREDPGYKKEQDDPKEDHPLHFRVKLRLFSRPTSYRAAMGGKIQKGKEK